MSKTNIALILVALSGIPWGLYWLPIRGLEEAGVAGLWSIILFNATPMVMLLPFALYRWRQFIAGGRNLHTAALLSGVALATVLATSPFGV